MGRLAKLHEDRYASTYDEVDDLINGGWDAFEADDDLLNPEKADAIHRNAQAAGMSDLDYVNREEALESIEDDWAYELETQDYYSDMSNVVNSRSIKDIYDEEAAEMADAGFISGGYGSRISDGPSLLNNIIEGAVQYIGDEIPTPDYNYKAFGPKVIQTWLEESAKYVGNPVTPKCEAFHEALVVLAQEYNDILQNVLGNPEWPEPIVVPAANGKVNESEELKPLTKKFMETLPTNIDSYKKFKAACKKAGYKASEADYGDYNQYYLKESSIAKKAKKLKEALEVYTFDSNQPKGEVIDLCAPTLQNAQKT